MADEGILIGITQMLLLAASRAGLSREAILAEAGVDEPGLADGDGRISLAQHRRIGEAMLSQLPPGCDLVVEVSRIVTPAAFGVVGKVAQNSASLRDALAAFVRYQQLIVGGARMELHPVDGGETLRFGVPPGLADLRYPMLSMLVCWVSLARQLTGSSCSPRRVTLAFAGRAGEAARLAAVYGVSPTFGAAHHELVFDDATLALPVFGARPDRALVLQSYADSLLSDLELQRGVRGKVCHQLLVSLPRGETRQDMIARELGMSGRTLSRRLKAEDTTFGDLLELVRREMSQRYLRDPQLSINEVTFLLGYSEPSTFFRAFKRWTGSTPRAWRADT